MAAALLSALSLASCLHDWDALDPAGSDLGGVGALILDPGAGDIHAPTAGPSLVGGTDYAGAGSSLAPARDANGDGLDDVLVGAPQGGHLTQGSVSLVHGRSSW